MRPSTPTTWAFWVRMHPGQPAAHLGRVDDVGPQPADVDQAQPARGTARRLLGAGSAGRSRRVSGAPDGAGALARGGRDGASGGRAVTSGQAARRPGGRRAPTAGWGGRSAGACSGAAGSGPGGSCSPGRRRELLGRRLGDRHLARSHLRGGDPGAGSRWAGSGRAGSTLAGSGRVGSERAGSGRAAGGRGATARAGAASAGGALTAPLTSRRRSSRSRRASTPSLAWSAPGSSTRAQISSSSSRGAVAPRISVSPAATMSAARLSSIAAEAGRLGDQPLALVLGDVDQAGRRGVGHRGDDHQVAQPAQQVLGEAARVLAGLDDLVDDPEDGRAVAGRERVDDLVEQGVGREAEQRGREVVGDARRTGAAEQLVEHGEGVAGRAAAGAHHQRQRGRLDRDALLGAELGEVVGEQPRRDQPERVVVGARPDRRQHLVRLGGGEDEAQVRRRLLDELEQRVEALRA